MKYISGFRCVNLVFNERTTKQMTRASKFLPSYWGYCVEWRNHRMLLWSLSAHRCVTEREQTARALTSGTQYTPSFLSGAWKRQNNLLDTAVPALENREFRPCSTIIDNGYLIVAGIRYEIVELSARSCDGAVDKRWWAREGRWRLKRRGQPNHEVAIVRTRHQNDSLTLIMLCSDQQGRGESSVVRGGLRTQIEAATQLESQSKIGGLWRKVLEWSNRGGYEGPQLIVNQSPTFKHRWIEFLGKRASMPILPIEATKIST